MAEGVAFAQGPLSNWTILVGDDEVALIDTGYPSDIDLVLESIDRAGGTGLPISTALITHGHSDHLGSARELRRRFNTTVLAPVNELPNVRRQVTEQITFADVLPKLWRPRVATWLWRAVRAGGLKEVGVVDAQSVGDSPLIVAGHTVVPIPTPGHSTGHTAYHLLEAGAVATGDAIVTAHPTSRVQGPQLLPDMFHANPARARSALASIARVSASTILPGHGPLLHGSPATSVSLAWALAPSGQTHPGARSGPMPDAWSQDCRRLWAMTR